MLKIPIEEVIEWIDEICMRPCDFTRDDFNSYETEILANNAKDYLEQLKD